MASNISISTLGISIERMGPETTAFPLTSHEVAGDSAHMEVIDQSRGDPSVMTGVITEESLETYTGGLWSPEKDKWVIVAFEAHVLAQESVYERVCLVSLASKINGLFGSLRKRLRNLRFSRDPSKGRTEPLSTWAQHGSNVEKRIEGTATPSSRGNKRRKADRLLQKTCPRTVGRGGLKGMSQAWHSWRTLAWGLWWMREDLRSRSLSITR